MVTGAHLKRDLGRGAMEVLGHRKNDFLQIIRHSAIWREDVLFSIASSSEGRFLYLIRFKFDDAVLSMHRNAFELVFDLHAPFTFEPSRSLLACVPNAGNIDTGSLHVQFELRRLLREKSPTQEHDGVIPQIVRTWNKSKSPIDHSTKASRKLKLITSRPGINAKLVIEGLLLATAGAVRLFQVNAMFDNLSAFTNQDSVAKAMSRVGSVRRIVRDAMLEKGFVAPHPQSHAGSTPGHVSIAEAHLAVSSQSFFSPEDPSYEQRILTELKNVHSSSARMVSAFNSKVLRVFRVTSTPTSCCAGHVMQTTSHEERRECVLCCRTCSKSGPSVDCSRRKGMSTSVRCLGCRVALCADIRENVYGANVSCWDVWHRVMVLPEHPKYRVSQITRLAAIIEAAPSTEKTNSARKRRKAAFAHVNHHSDGVASSDVVPYDQQSSSDTE